LTSACGADPAGPRRLTPLQSAAERADRREPRSRTARLHRRPAGAQQDHPASRRPRRVPKR